MDSTIFHFDIKDTRQVLIEKAPFLCRIKANDSLFMIRPVTKMEYEIFIKTIKYDDGKTPLFDGGNIKVWYKIMDFGSSRRKKYFDFDFNLGDFIKEFRFNILYDEFGNKIYKPF